MKKVIFNLIILLIAIQSEASEYRICAVNKETIKVEASFTLKGKNISMLIKQSPDLPDDGSAAFVNNLIVSDSEGNPILYKYLKYGDWELTVTDENQLVHVVYEISLTHENYNWPSGIEEVAYVNDSGVYLAGRSLFIMPSLDGNEKIEIIFDLPDDWSASTPWKKHSNNANFFTASSFPELYQNCLFIGTHTEQKLQINDFEFRMVIDESLGSAKDSLVNWLSIGVESISNMFQATPGSSYLVILNSGNRTDGGAYIQSFSMMLEGNLTSASKNVWIHGILHETFHLWNGLVIDGDELTEWFTEGFTEYMTVVHLSRNQLVSKEVVIKKLEGLYRKYILAKLMQNINDPLTLAGSEKSQNRLLIYGGGAMVAFALDVEIRKATQNKKGLDDLLRNLFNDYGLNDKDITTEIVLNEINKITSQDFTWFFNKYVRGRDYLDMRPYFKGAGLELYSFIEEVYSNANPNATDFQKQIGTSIFGYSFNQQ